MHLDLGLWLWRPSFQLVSEPAVGRWDGGVDWVVPWVPESHTLVLPVGSCHLSCRVTHPAHGPRSQGSYPRGWLCAFQHYDTGPTGLSRHPCPRGRWRQGGKEGLGSQERRQAFTISSGAGGTELNLCPRMWCPELPPARGLDRGPDSWLPATALAPSLPSSVDIARAMEHMAQNSAMMPMSGILSRGQPH